MVCYNMVSYNIELGITKNFIISSERSLFTNKLQTSEPCGTNISPRHQKIKHENSKQHFSACHVLVFIIGHYLEQLQNFSSDCIEKIDIRYSSRTPGNYDNFKAKFKKWIKFQKLS